MNNRLYDILTSLGITQAKFAQETGLASGTINRYCANKQQPSLTNKNLIKNTLNRIAPNDEKYEVKDIFPENEA